MHWKSNLAAELLIANRHFLLYSYLGSIEGFSIHYSRKYEKYVTQTLL